MCVHIVKSLHDYNLEMLKTLVNNVDLAQGKTKMFY